MAKSQHVVPHGDGWAIQREGSRKFTSIHGSKQEAIDEARRIARRESVEIVIHGRNGQALYSSDLPTKIDEDRFRDAVRSLAQKPTPRPVVRKRDRAATGGRFE